MDALDRTQGNQYTNIAIRYKRQINDILDAAFAGDKRMWLYKKFSIECFDKDLKTKLGDCRHLPDGSSYIRILHMESLPASSMFITVIHEVSHHIDHIQRRKSGHDAPFFAIHKLLVFTALDMGIISKADIKQWHQKSTSSSKNKVYAFLQSYSPHPIPYHIEDTVIRVTNAFLHRTELRQRGYYWNALNKSWDKELYRNMVDDEQEWLQSIGIPDQYIFCTDKSMLKLREHTIVRVFHVPYEQREKMRAMKYKWNSHKKCWEKRISENVLPQDERDAIQQLCQGGQEPVFNHIK